MQTEPTRPEGFQQIEALYHAALRLPSGERVEFLAQACGGNQVLRQEIESLLKAHDRAGNFIESPALEIAAVRHGGKRPSLIGQQIGRYKILAAVGAGGMGEVYKAQDPRLDREVAIKILPASVAIDPAAMTRFKREARAVAALSHPNILALHDFDFDGDTHFAVMELLQGETVGHRLSGKPMDWREAAEVAIAVADGLAAAHKKGIIHRDIKPANIFLTSDGQVKILDFGIARTPAATDAPTQTQATLPGLAIGTMGYMSPEQIRGEPVDAASDIFALGCVLHEMVTGKQAFARDTFPEAVAAILAAEPAPMRTSIPGVPVELEEVVQRCLRKQPAERFPSASELALALRRILQGGRPAVTAPLPAARWRVAAWVAAGALAVAGAASLLLPVARTPTAYTDSIAVLPIANQSGNPEWEYVTDGITECLINNLSQFPKLKVIARTTAFRYKGRNVDPQQAGRELKVRRVFTGRLVRQGDFMGIQVDLVNVADGSQVWGYHYNQKLSDLVALPENISGKISDSLQLKLSGLEQRRLSRGRTENQEAFRLYLLGRYTWNQRVQRRPGTVEKSIAYFEQAIEKDPGYALAYVGMAEAYSTLPGYSEFSPADAARKGKAAARKALEIDETVFEAYVALASIAADEWDWTEAEKGFRRALQLNPGYALGHQWYAECLEKMARVKEALAEQQKAYELDPLSTAISLGAASLLYDDMQYDRAIQQLRAIAELNPDLGMAHMHIGLALLAQGKNKEALVEFERANALMPGGVSALVGYANAKSGNRQAALEILRQVQDPAKRHRGTPFDQAILYMGLGDLDRTFDFLNEACDQRVSPVERLKVDPFFIPLRSDPRYARLLRRMNLTP